MPWTVQAQRVKKFCFKMQGKNIQECSCVDEKRDIAVCKKSCCFHSPPFQAVPRHGWATAGTKQVFYSMTLPLNRAPPLNMKVVRCPAASL